MGISTINAVYLDHSRPIAAHSAALHGASMHDKVVMTSCCVLSKFCWLFRPVATSTHT
ncbi:hypothetical protein FIBSPDRAFT_877208 [Athelia psychrophila]|uniref:Uncharacterized protein n=1 Tax=Athelia psychrophila TaxID=1759441 RepID=A0A167W5T0_9AGAM|nr:hypothetical protein FIBSPDRAFT_877208 [Fibularhizoctonia sp. CBS 109695]